MATRHKEGTLTQEERRAVKALIAEGMRNQDIQDLVNRGRRATINAARITEVKQDATQEAATEAELELFKIKRKLYDPVTGLNEIDHERLIRAREAMMMAVHIFNSPQLRLRPNYSPFWAILRGNLSAARISREVTQGEYFAGGWENCFDLRSFCPDLPARCLRM